MHITILGGGGFIGGRLAKTIVENEGLLREKVDRLTLIDISFSADRLNDPRVHYVEADFSEDKTMHSLVDSRPDIIFHLAAVVSGEAEKNFELGMRVNFHASLQLLELCRTTKYCPRIVFSSSCGVFGGDVSKVITDETGPKPRSSYGTQKALVELLMNDYSRRGFVDARSLRLPTIAVRPGRPNAATSSFISSIIREPLNGLPATYPVFPQSQFWILSPKRVVDNLIHAANIDGKLLGDDRMISLPGLTVSVGEMISSLEKIAGREVTDLISYKPDAFLQGIVLTWPPNFLTPRADALGFQRDTTVDEIIKGYIEEQGIGKH